MKKESERNRQRALNERQSDHLPAEIHIDKLEFRRGNKKKERENHAAKPAIINKPKQKYRIQP